MRRLAAERCARGAGLLQQTNAHCTPSHMLVIATPAPPHCSEPPICLTGGLNVDDCASGTDTCWRGTGAGVQPLSGCVDTFRGYVCRCPQGGRGVGRPAGCVWGTALAVQVCCGTRGS